MTNEKVTMTMTAEEARQFEAFQTKKRQEAEKERVARERATYKDVRDDAVRKLFEKLQDVSNTITQAKEEAFNEMKAIIELKNELFATKEDRNTDTFTTSDGKISITLGNRVTEGWADTVEVGIVKVKNYLRTLAKDENSADLVEIVMGLLAKDRKGNIKASKVLELKRHAEKSGDAEFLDGVSIIEDAYRPEPTRLFVSAKYRNEDGKEVNLPLSMSAAG